MSTNKNTTLLIGQVARNAGVSADTIRYYERIKLLDPPGRTSGGYRSYHPDVVERLRFIQKAQRCGFTLDEVRNVLNSRGTGRVPCRQVIKLAENKLENLESQLIALTALRDGLTKNVRKWKRQKNERQCAASQFCNLIEDLPL